MLPTPRVITRTSFKVKGVGWLVVKVTRWINAKTGSASYLPNGKAYELETSYTDGVVGWVAQW